MGRVEDFLSLKSHERGSVSFGDGKKKGYILNVEKIGKSLNQAIVDVHYVDGLKYNLMSVSQIYVKENEVKFMVDKFTITSLKNSEIILTAWRTKNMYVADLGSYNTKNLPCLCIQDDVAELWHKKLGR